MPEPIVTPTAEAPDTGLFSRFVGVLLSPRDTFAGVVRRPRWLGMLALIILVTIACTGWFQSTTIGRQATLDEATRRIESFGVKLSDQQYQQMEQQILNAPVWRLVLQSTAGVVIVTPLILLLLAGILFAAFAVMGGDASFKQLFAVVVHANAITVVQQLFITPLNYARESLTSATNLAVFFPMLDEGSFPARLLGMIDLFRVWWVMLLAVGLAVLYRRRTRSIALALFSVYAVLALAIATVMAIIAARSAA
jgi:hypothetical protein